MSDRDFAGKVAWITGGARGFGEGAARRLASIGATIVISDVETAAGQRVAEDLDGAFVACDVSRFEDSQAAVASVVERYGRLDVAFLNAGVSTGCGMAADFDPAAYRRAMSVNLDGVVYGAHAAFAALAADGGGALVATASLAGLTGTPFDPIYGANKHGVVGLVRSLGPDWVQHGVRVNALCPGFADTQIVDPLRETLAAGGIPLIPVEHVVDGFMAALTSDGVGECWYVQPGRPPEPFKFRGIPGPRSADPE
ncbi:MAG TPA: SDR family NAD(P)-dependent oxidoreductase [Mycobacteriales bacterium]|nr:SDR family NAD(P)-dependent oxidoreductase [Mycobacteriales bacterium]